MEWNNGTIFRALINSGTQTTVDCKLDIAQQDLNNKVFIGIENFVLAPNTGNAILLTYWQTVKYLQLESVQLTPYIDFSSQNADTDIKNDEKSRSTSMFARMPLIDTGTIDGVLRFSADRVLNKTSILYEMRNNPMALSNGRLRFRLLDESGDLIGSKLDQQELPMTSFAFTLVVYKPDNNYN